MNIVNIELLIDFCIFSSLVTLYFVTSNMIKKHFVAIVFLFYLQTFLAIEMNESIFYKLKDAMYIYYMALITHLVVCVNVLKEKIKEKN